MTEKDKNVINFYNIYENIGLNEKLEGEYRKLIETKDSQNNVIHSSLQALSRWKEKLLNEYDIVDHTDDKNPENEELLKQKLYKLENLSNEISDHCERIIPTTSTIFFDKKREFDDAYVKYQETKDTLKINAQDAFDDAIIKQFQEWRSDEIQQLRKSIQSTMKSSFDGELLKLLESRKQQLQECETIMELQEKIASTRMALSIYPLETKERLQEYEDNLFKQRETLKILQKQLKFVQKSYDGSLSRSTSRKTSKDTQRTKISDGIKRRQTIYEQIFKGERKRFEKQETGSSTTADDE